MQIVLRCKAKSKAHDKENQRNNNQYSSVNHSVKLNSVLLPLKELPISNDHMYSSIPSTVISSKEDDLLIKSLDFMEPIKTEKSDNETYLSIYGDSIRRESLAEQSFGMFLKDHRIDSSLRARMLDWMTQVTRSYKFQAKTYFDGANYMDRYLLHKKKPIEPTDLHALGVVSMLMASKIHEVYPLRIGMVYQKIGHKKISMNKLISLEADLMKTLDYQLNQWTFFDIASISISNFEDQFLLKVLAYIQYEFYSKIKPALMGQACAWVVLSIFNMKEPIWMNKRIDVNDCGRKILNLVRGFKSVHSTLKNIDRFTQEEVIQKVNQFLQGLKNDF